jgi:hypothetical protein
MDKMIHTVTVDRGEWFGVVTDSEEVRDDIERQSGIPGKAGPDGNDWRWIFEKSDAHIDETGTIIFLPRKSS